MLKTISDFNLKAILTGVAFFDELQSLKVSLFKLFSPDFIFERSIG
jgi:hypothetical protein